MLALGIDLGGTELKLALVTAAGEVVTTRHAPTGVEIAPDALLETMARLALPLLDHGDVLRVAGLCAPGPLDLVQGTIEGPPTLPRLARLAIVHELEARLGIAVRLANDAHAATLAEWRFGAGRGCENFVYLTVSTGIGGGAVVDGRLLQGQGGLAGHVGHMLLAHAPGGRLRTWEELASGSALAALAAEALRAEPGSALAAIVGDRPATARDVGAAAGLGDPLALRLLADEARHLGHGIVTLVHLLAPRRIILGGGVSALFDRLLPGIESAVARHALPGFLPVAVVPAALGSAAGVIGAAALAFADGVAPAPARLLELSP